jgi:hypothetical protein
LPGADDEIDIGRPLPDKFLILLGHAADDADDLAGILPLERGHPAHGGVRLLLGQFPHGTGVEEQHIGLGRFIRQAVALLLEGRHDQLAVQHVHLAADGFDVHFLRVAHDRGSVVNTGPKG